MRLFSLTIVLFSLIPANISSIVFGFNNRLLGMPVVYLIFVSLSLAYLLKNYKRIINSRIAITFLFCGFGFVLYAVISSLFKSAATGYEIDPALFLEAGMYILYFTIFVSWYTNFRLESDDVILREIRFYVISVFLACILGALRYKALGEASYTSFFNIVPALQYRFFEVYILVLALQLTMLLMEVTGKHIYVYFAFVFVMTILATESRTGFVVLVFNLGAFIYIYRQKINLKWIAALVVGLVVSVTMFLGTNVEQRIKRLSDAGAMFTADVDSALEDSQSVRRTVLIAATTQMLLDNPLTGVGLGGYFKYFPDEYSGIMSMVAKPHNLYMYILSTSGIFGFLVYFAFWFFLLKQHAINFVQSKKSKIAYIFFLFPLSVLLGSLGYQMDTNPLIWIMLAFVLGVSGRLAAVSHANNKSAVRAAVRSVS